MKILVAGVGNIFLGDDAFGSEVARALTSRPLADGVVVKDLGIRGLDLVYTLLDDWDFVILIDASPRGGDPGTLYVIEPEDIDHAELAIEPHAMNPMNVLEAARAMGSTAPVRIVACEPADLGGDDGKLGLSDVVAASIDDAVRLVEFLIEKIRANRTVVT
jgi:hydrogenase maturation protease